MALMERNSSTRPRGSLVSVQEAAKAIQAGRPLMVAGDEALLANLPRGCWIGGTIPYFMGDQGGEVTKSKVFITEVPAFEHKPEIAIYSPETLPSICTDAAEHGYTLVIIPAFSPVHLFFAQNAPEFEDMYMRPLVGWVSGVHLDDLGTVLPKVIDGATGKMYSNRLIAFHVTLPETWFARLGVINIFESGNTDVICFANTGMAAKECTVNGQPRSLAEYLKEQNADFRLPLVGDYCGARINVSVQTVVEETGVVEFYAPVFPGVEYRLAMPIDDYLGSFEAALDVSAKQAPFSCNCILNFLYSELEGRHAEGFSGPMTYGEVGYQLLNQTMVYLTLEQV